LGFVLTGVGFASGELEEDVVECGLAHGQGLGRQPVALEDADDVE
jgi:hypothetical protein